ncbi:MAG: hypothetical protein FJ254_01255 [Phycisphaerae bacterium]|nr:hypothetical protein [Phycisphaerae bacterium]
MIDDPDGIADEAYLWLRGHLEGHLCFDGERRQVKIVIAPDGRIVAPVMVAVLACGDVVLELPDGEPDSMQLSVTPERFVERGEDAALCDRWRIYHGDAPDVNWARLAIDACRHAGYYVDAEAVVVPNSLAAIEPAACKALNADPASLLRVMPGSARTSAKDVRVVGIDPDGMDVRRAFDVVRVPWPDGVEVTSVDSALAAIRAMAG